MENDKKSILQKLSDKALDLDAQLDGLKQTAKGVSADLKEEFARVEAEIKKQRKDAEAKMEELKKSSGEGWEELKAGADKAVSDLHESIARAKEKFKGK